MKIFKCWKCLDVEKFKGAVKYFENFKGAVKYFEILKEHQKFRKFKEALKI